VRRVLAEGRNVIVATGTGSGKSFAFGIPIVSEALRMREERVRGIKAVIVYPMNALANSQYDDLSRRLHGSGLTISRYTGDTAASPTEALDRYRRATGRDAPYDSELLSREEIQETPPDILMTNYVMLELLLTRFEDRGLFAQPGVLRFLVLDRARALLHEEDPDGGCERACYECLLGSCNQRDHPLIDRQQVLLWLQGPERVEVEAEVDEGAFATLAVQCQSELERGVLEAIRDRALPLPGAVQETLYDTDGGPLAIADSWYPRE